MHFDKYPKEMPTAEIGMVISYLKGDTTHDLHCVAGSCWWIIGYGMSFIPSGHEMKAAAEHGDETLLVHLETLVSPGVHAFPWELVLPLVIKLFERLLDRL